MDELIKPNWHPVLVHFPIALLLMGTFVELFSVLGWRRSGLRAAGRWMVLLGAITSVPTALVGLYALRDALGEGGVAGLDALAASRVRQHVLLQSISTALAMGLVTLWIGFSDRWRDRLNVLFKLGLLGVSGLIVVGSWHAGEMVYAHDIGTKNPPTSLPSTLPAADAREIENAFATLFPLEQVHVAMAGLSLAMACVALGFSSRLIAASALPPANENETEAAQRIAMAFSQDVGSIGEPRHLAAAEAVVVRSPNFTPIARAWPVWLLASLLLLGTFAGGLWVLAHGLGTWDVDALKSAITKPVEPEDPAVTRRLVHTVTGITIVSCALLLTLAGLAAPRSKLLLTLLATVLLLAMLVQRWVGALLVLEGPPGRVTELNWPT
jgi:uncharacterized membrane protein